MKNKKYIKLHFFDTEEEQNNQLIALLADIGFTGFEEDDKTLTAFIDEENFKSDELDNIFKIIPSVYSKTIVNEENWNAQWERSFEPIVVNDFVAIRADFHQSIKDVKHEIVITPKMSFGTGHHATTYMMIGQMAGLEFAGRSVVDYGTGTAVLAIMAEKMGAVAIDAIDHDEWSIANSIENTAANHCNNIRLIKDETIAGGKVYDIVLANINLNVIIQNLPAINACSKKGTIILLSGFMKPDESIIKNAFAEYGMHHLKTEQKGEWICIRAQMT